MRLCLLSVVLVGAALAEEQRITIPTQKAQQDAEKTIREIFQAEYAKSKAPDRLQLAETLIAQALQTHDDLVARYVLLREAAAIAAQAGNANTAMRAIDEMAKSFAVERFALKQSALEEASQHAGSAESARILAESCLSLVAEAIDADHYEPALKLMGLADPAARRSQDRELQAAVTARAKEVSEIQRQYKALGDMLKKAGASPPDPAAALAVGKFACFIKGDWERGLPLLAKGSDAALKLLAEGELGQTTEAAVQLMLADGWFELFEKESGLAKANLRRRASKWYQQAAAKATGLTQTRIKQRLQKLEEGTPKSVVKNLAALNELSYVVGSEAQSKGIKVLEYKNDGAFEYVNPGKPALKFERHVYFDLDNDWAQKTTSAEVEVEYVDGKGGLQVEYNGKKEYSLAAEHIKFTGSKALKSAKLKLSDCNFRNALNAGGDLRLRNLNYDDKSAAVIVTRVTVRRVQ